MAVKRLSREEVIKAAKRVKGKNLRDVDHGTYKVSEPEKAKKKCEAGMPICSGQLVRTYGVNGSEKEGKTFNLCGPCMVYLKRGGAKMKAVNEQAARAGTTSSSKRRR